MPLEKPVRYRRRAPETTLLCQVVREHLRTFLAAERQRSAHGFGLPRFVVREFDEYLRCGQLSEGFCRIVCRDCGDERLVAFSCKGRAVCPSCATRRMHDVAAHLCDRVLPQIDYRQWVLSMPRYLRFRLARDGALASRALRAFLGAVFTWQRRRARKAGVAKPLCGAVTFVQRFASALNLNLHWHSLLPDSVFSLDDDGSLGWHPLPPPTDDDVAALLVTIVRRIDKLVAAPGTDADDADVDESDALTAAQAASVKARLPPDPDAPRELGPLCAFLRGFSLHANVHIPARDRQGLERLCRYGARPPLALERLSRADDGTLRLRLKRPTRAGVRELSFTPLELLGKLAVLVPPPRENLTRYHGVFAAHAKARRLVLPPPPGDPPETPAPEPASPAPRPPPTPAAEPDRAASADPAPTVPRVPPPQSYRIPWAELLKRVFRLDVMVCDRCGGRLRVLAYLTDPDVVRRILDHLRLPSTAPCPAPARASPDDRSGDAPFPDDPGDAPFSDEPA